MPTIDIGSSETEATKYFWEEAFEASKNPDRVYDSSSVERIYACHNLEVEPHIYDGMFCYYAARSESSGNMESLQISTQYCEPKQAEYQKYFSMAEQSAAAELMNQFRSSTAEISMEQVEDFYVVTLQFPNFDSAYADLGNLDLFRMSAGALDLPGTMEQLNRNGWKTLAGQIYPNRTGSFEYFYFLDSHHINETMYDISYSESLTGIRDEGQGMLQRFEFGYYEDQLTCACINTYLDIRTMSEKEAEELVNSAWENAEQIQLTNISANVLMFDWYVCSSLYISDINFPETLEGLQELGILGADETFSLEQVREDLEDGFILR